MAVTVAGTRASGTAKSNRQCATSSRRVVRCVRRLTRRSRKSGANNLGDNGVKDGERSRRCLNRRTTTQARAIAWLRKPSENSKGTTADLFWLLQLRVLCFGLPVDGDVGVGVFP